MEEKKVSLKKNIIYSVLYQVLIMVTPIITAPYTSRLFGADGNGIASFTNSIVAYFMMFAALGTATYGQKEIAGCRDDKSRMSRTFWEIELLCLTMTGICLAGWIVLLLASTKYTAYYLALTLSIIAVPMDITWLYAGLENFRLILLRNAMVRLAGIVALFGFVHSKSQLLLYIGLTAAIGLAGNISMWFSLGKYVEKPVLRELRVRRHFQQTLVFFVPTIATSIYNIADKTMLGLITNDEAQNGYYEQANKVVGMSKAVLYAITNVLTSRMSYLFAKNEEEKFRSLLDKSLQVMFFLAFPMAFGIAAIAGQFVPLYLGPGYEEVIRLLPVSASLELIIGISNSLEKHYYTPTGKRKLSNWFVIAGAILNVILNAILIPISGAMGATIASVAAEAVISALYIWFVRSVETPKQLVKSAYRYLIAGALMWLCLYFLNNKVSIGWFTLAIDVILGAIVYMIILLIMRDPLLGRIVKGKRI